jgi:GDP/UDP-N,N'-diacetylbacillosamine 2-epimerase (hydrolysing)
MKVAVYTGSRSEYGLLLPVLRALRADPDVELLILIGGSHTDPAHGMTGEQVSRDGFDACVAQSLWQSHAGGAPLRAQASEVGVQLIGVAEALDEIKPDWLLVYGDRGETLGAAIAAHYQRIPITELAALALTTNRDAQMLMDERSTCARVPHPVFVGLPSLDRDDVQRAHERCPILGTSGAPVALLALNPEPPTLIATQGEHGPVTLGLTAYVQAAVVLRCLRDAGCHIIATTPNSDPGNDETLACYAEWGVAVRPPMAPHEYYELLATVSGHQHGGFMIGNSSSAIKEAPAFGIPVVDVGDRQSGRNGPHRYRPGWHPLQIGNAIKAALSPDGQARAQANRGTDYGYGDGRAGTRVVAALKGAKR